MKEKKYFQTIEDFTREIDGENVRCVVCAALVDSEQTADVVSFFGCGPFEMASIAGILQMHAGLMYQETNEEEDEEG